MKSFYFQHSRFLVFQNACQIESTSGDKGFALVNDDPSLDAVLPQEATRSHEQTLAIG